MLNVEHSQVRSSIFCVKNLTDIPWSIFNRFVQNAAHFLSSPPLGKSLFFNYFEGLSSVDTSLAPRDSPRPPREKLGMSPSSIGHGGQYPLVMGVSMVSNSHSLTRYCERHSWGSKFVLFYLNQPARRMYNGSS